MTRRWAGPALLFTLLLLPAAACRAQAPTPAAAAAAYRSGQYEEAIDGYRRLVDADPSDAQARRGLVRALYEVGRYDEAAATARDARAAAGELANLLGEALYARGEVAAAEAAFRRAVEADAADRATAELNLAVLLHERGEREEAMRRFDGFIDLYNGSSALSAPELTAVGMAVQYLGATDPQLFRDALQAFDEAAAADPAALEPRIRAGELFLAKYNGPDALTSFEQVLVANPNHPRGLLGMGRALNFAGQPTAMEAVQRALEVNPNLVPARVELARLYLDQENAAAAETELEKALEVNPNSLDALSLLAGLRVLRDQELEYEELRERVLHLNARHAGFYTAVGELAVRYRRYADAAEFARQALELDPQSYTAQGLLGLNLLRLGQVAPAREALERAFAGDPYNVWFKNTLDLLDTYSSYRTLSTERFELVMHEDEADLLFPYAATLAEEAYDSLSARYGYAPRTPVRVEFYPRHADFSVRTVGLAGMGALGVAFGNVLAMDSPAARERGDFNWGTTLWHEIAHAVTMGLSRHRVPRWLTEGLSVREERRARPAWGADVSLGFLRVYVDGGMPPASRLSEVFVRPATPLHVGYAYYESSLVAEWIEETRGFEAIRAMLRGYGEGRSTEQLILSVLGTEPERFDEEFDTWLRARFELQIAALGAPTGDGGAAAGGYPGLLREGRKLMDAGQLDEAREVLERAVELFPAHAGEGSPNALLVRLHEQQGDTTAAVDALTRLVAVDENAYDANLRLAELLEARGDVVGASAALERAIYVSPYELSLHTRLAGLYAGLGDRSGVVRERRAILALRPVDSAEARYQLALALLDAGDHDGARRAVLGALEVAPGFAAAQELLLRLSGAP